jgi:protein HIRA/HIR1
MQESWRVVKRLRDHNSDVQDLAWSSDGRYLASCGMDGHIIVWDAHTFGKAIDNNKGKWRHDANV